MDNFEIIFELQKIYDDYNKINSCKADMEKLWEQAEKKSSLELSSIRKKYNDRISVPSFSSITDRLSITSDQDVKQKIKDALVTVFIEFENNCKQVASDYNDELQPVLDSIASTMDSKYKKLESEFHAAVDKVNSNELISKKYIDLIPEIIDILNEGRASSLTDALNLAIKNKSDKDFYNEKIRIETEKLEELQRQTEIEEERRAAEEEEREIRFDMEQKAREKAERRAEESAENSAGVAHCSACWNYNKCYRFEKNSKYSLDCYNFNK